MKYFLCLAFLICTGVQANPAIPYSVPAKPWDEALGNHRAVLEVSAPAEAVTLDITWRRHDPDPGKKRFIILNALTGDTVPNILRYEVNGERCHIVFGPVKEAGQYYFYYLPYEVLENWGFYDKDYLEPEAGPGKEWLASVKDRKPGGKGALPAARLTAFQSRTAFDSFYPMEVTALASEKKALLKKNPGEWLSFTEDRLFPIRMLDELPQRWVEKGPSVSFTGTACRNEYYAFQVGVYAVKKKLEDLQVVFSELRSGNNIIPASMLTCFNTGGTGPYGQPFTKRVDVAAGHIQPLWIGADIPEDLPPGTYRGTIQVKPANAAAIAIDVKIIVDAKVLTDRGDNETWRHSRLRWLNSKLGTDDAPVRPYKPVEMIGETTCRLTDKIVKMSYDGFPSEITVAGNSLLDGPLRFVVETGDGVQDFGMPSEMDLLKREPGIISGRWKSYSPGMSLTGIASVEADGYINYRISLKAEKTVQLSDIRLEIPFRSSVARYMIGMGLPGTAVPGTHQAAWRGPYDSFWMGDTHAGLWCELRGATYCGPLLNLYHPDPPPSWYNDDRGGFRITRSGSRTTAVAYSGKRELKAGGEIIFEWSILLTPVKKTDPSKQFTNRYYHNGGAPMPSDSDLACGVRVVNLHHANNYNPHINYPFIAVDSMRWFVDRMHSKGQKVKIYYTIRELTNYTTELWALRSLGNEILGDGDGGGYPWLREHLVSGYRPQWYQHFPDKSPDASIVNAPGDSRWYNYYVEGLRWLVRNVGIDGLYLDDVTYDRRTLKRMRKVLDNEKPGCMIDLHSNTGFSKGPANQYAEYFPYIDKLWFGESFRYDEMSPENWLVETSGIPFGLMGDMLQGGGNRWLGMVYGMTVRHPWLTEGVTCDPRPVWEIWDQFGIADAEMTGYWEDSCPVKTDNEAIKATVYRKKGKTLIASGCWADKETEFRMSFDWKTLGLDPARAVLEAPYIMNFQEHAVFMPGDPIKAGPKKGWIFILHEN